MGLRKAASWASVCSGVAVLLCVNTSNGSNLDKTFSAFRYTFHISNPLILGELRAFRASAFLSHVIRRYNFVSFAELFGGHSVRVPMVCILVLCFHLC